MEITIKDLLVGLVLVVQVIGVKAGFRLADILSDIRDHLAQLNGKVVQLETWTTNHEKLDDERTASIRQQIRDCPLQQGNHLS